MRGKHPYERTFACSAVTVVAAVVAARATRQRGAVLGAIDARCEQTERHEHHLRVDLETIDAIDEGKIM